MSVVSYQHITCHLSLGDLLVLRQTCKELRYCVHDVLCERGVSIPITASRVLLAPEWTHLRRLEVYNPYWIDGHIVTCRDTTFPIPRGLRFLDYLRLRHLTMPPATDAGYWEELLTRCPSLKYLEVDVDIFCEEYASYIRHLRFVVEAAAPNVHSLRLHTRGILIHPTPPAGTTPIAPVYGTLLHINALPPVVSSTLRHYRLRGGHVPLLAVDAPLESLELEESMRDGRGEGLARLGPRAWPTLQRLTWQIFGLYTEDHFSALPRLAGLHTLEIDVNWLKSTARLALMMGALSRALPPLVETLQLTIDTTVSPYEEWEESQDALLPNASIKRIHLRTWTPTRWMHGFVRALDAPRLTHLKISAIEMCPVIIENIEDGSWAFTEECTCPCRLDPYEGDMFTCDCIPLDISRFTAAKKVDVSVVNYEIQVANR